MYKIRLGNDVSFTWPIFKKIGNVLEPYDLTDRNLSLYVVSSIGKQLNLKLSIEGNVVKSTFYGKDQTALGVYKLVLYENRGEAYMHTVDTCDFIELVSCSCKAQSEVQDNINLDVLELSAATIDMNSGSSVVDSELSETSSNPVENRVVTKAINETNDKIDEGLASKQDTISDLEEIRSGAAKGATALQEESDPVYLADKPSLALKSEIPDISGKVDKEEGKELSSNDYTDEEKAKLARLQNYDDSVLSAKIGSKADKVHTHTVSDITDFPELSYDATWAIISETYTLDQFDALHDAIQAKKVIYVNTEGNFAVLQPMTMTEGLNRIVELHLMMAEDSGNFILMSFVLNPAESLNVNVINSHVPTRTSQLTNDSGFVTQVDLNSAINTKLNTEV